MGPRVISMATVDIFVSALVITENHAAILPAFIEEVSSLLRRHYTNHEIVIVDNVSTDATATVLGDLLVRLPCIRYVRLTRATDRETAIIAGLDATIGDYVVTIDPDLDPPQELVAMVDACRKEPDIVLGVARGRHPNPVYRCLRPLFHSLAKLMVGVDLAVGETGFRAISREAVNALVSIRVRRRYFAVVAAEAGLRIAHHPYVRHSRLGRVTAPRLWTAARTGAWVLLNNSLAPLRTATFLGLIGSFVSLLYSLYVVVSYLSRTDIMPGWTTLSLAISGLFFLQFFILSLMGEYLGRLLDESTNRPLYHVRDELSSAVLLTDASRKNVCDQPLDTPAR